MVVVAPIIIPAHVHHQRRIVDAFRAAGATERSRATSLEKLELRDGHAANVLRRHEILRDAGNQLLWLDEAAWTTHDARRRRFALRFAGGLLLLVTAALLTLWLALH